MPGYNFNAHAKFDITEQVNNKSLSKSKICRLFEYRENLWIFKLEIVSPQGLKISLSYPQDTTGYVW